MHSSCGASLTHWAKPHSLSQHDGFYSQSMFNVYSQLVQLSHVFLFVQSVERQTPQCSHKHGGQGVPYGSYGFNSCFLPLLLGL